jgi:hypothetical protein
MLSFLHGKHTLKDSSTGRVMHVMHRDAKTQNTVACAFAAMAGLNREKTKEY